MRKQDIIVTVPTKSVIYAIGTAPENNPKVWYDPASNYYDKRSYVPGYVLKVEDSGFAIVLMANRHPDEQYAKYMEQASVLDALDYSLKDYEARQAVLAEYSHWPLSKEQSDAKYEALEGLKKVPNEWQVKAIRTTYVRMLWADYATRLDTAGADVKDKEARAAAEKEADVEARRALFERIVALDVGLPEAELEYNLNRTYDKNVYLPLAVVQALVEGYGKAAA